MHITLLLQTQGTCVPEVLSYPSFWLWKAISMPPSCSWPWMQTQSFTERVKWVWSQINTIKSLIIWFNSPGRSVI